MKHYITNGDRADFAIVFAVTDAEKRADGGITAFVVPRDQFRVGKMQWTMADGAPGRAVVRRCAGAGRPRRSARSGRGFQAAMSFLNARPGRVRRAVASGLAEFCLDEAVDARPDAGPRSASRSAANQGVSFPLAECKVEIEAMRWMTYHLAWAVDEGDGRPLMLDASIAKFYATERAYAVADRCLQVFGGMGLLKEGPIERVLRHLRVLRVVEGASEVQKLVIARSMGLCQPGRLGQSDGRSHGRLGWVAPPHESRNAGKRAIRAVSESGSSSRQPAAARRTHRGFGPNEWLVDEIYQQYLAGPELASTGLVGLLRRLQAGRRRAPAPTAATAPRRPARRGHRRPPAPPPPPTAPAPAPAATPPPAPTAPPTARRRRPRSRRRPPSRPGQPRRSPPPPAAADGRSPRRSRPRRRGRHALQGPGRRASSPTWRPASRCRPPPACARCRPSCSSTTASSSTTTCTRGRGGKVSLHPPDRLRAGPGARGACPEMNNAFAEVDGKPALVKPEHVNLGLAIDLPKPDGTRTLRGAVHQGRRDDGLRAVLGGLRGHRPPGPQQQADRRRLRRHHDHA